VLELPAVADEVEGGEEEEGVGLLPGLVVLLPGVVGVEPPEGAVLPGASVLHVWVLGWTVNLSE
jgi:hypothetical protein